MPPTNKAAWLLTYENPSLVVKEAPYTFPSTNQIVVRAHAVSINPVDAAIPFRGAVVFPWLKLPFILGSDISGEIVELGPGVENLKVGDRVVGQCLAWQHNNPVEGAYQEYVVMQQNMVCKIPDEIPYEEAAVLPLCLATAACGLFEKRFLGLEFPSFEPREQGKTVMIWGGSTSVGCNAVQLAVAAGYEVFSTASPKNFEMVKKLGAKMVFDHNSATAVEEIVAALKGKTIAGAYAIGAPTSDRNGFSAGEACLEIVKRSEGRKFAAMAMHGPAELAPEGVEAKFVTGEQFKTNEVGKMIYGEYLPRALKERKFLCMPEAVVVGNGLEKIQEAFEVQKKGVSAKKIVVTL
ncbi:GroES-like protein [Mollisia scopiformis]|uniref:GroES-like protein n=1 Tax=Mollisia scopiformis TaxID=149040 RepID=A0A194XTP5_MOLSC|nr:GroES-like protein [Mollisia scopiformis]KUJ23690.1 GroES-like protein [Mollisia scopiformis]